MNRIFCVVLTTCCLLSFTGCKTNVVGGANVEKATLVTFEQFREANKDEEAFWYLGSDADHQYFRTINGFYRIPTSSGAVPEDWVKRSKRRFDEGVPVGKVGVHASIRGDSFGVPEGNNREVGYPPLD